MDIFGRPVEEGNINHKHISPLLFNPNDTCILEAFSHISHKAPDLYLHKSQLFLQPTILIVFHLYQMSHMQDMLLSQLVFRGLCNKCILLRMNTITRIHNWYNVLHFPFYKFHSNSSRLLPNHYNLLQ